MHHSRQITASAVGIVLLGLVAAFGGAVANETVEDSVSLRWALGARDAAGAEPSAIKRDTRLEGGTGLKFLVEPLSAGSVYLILLDSTDDVHVLYRESATRNDNGGEPAYIPPGKEWFELDDSAGLETFFLLASTVPLEKLDNLLDELNAAGESSAELGTQIVAEIRRLHKAHRQFSRPIEKPVMIGGQTRGEMDAASAIDQLAVEITAERFYGKTITIDH